MLRSPGTLSTTIANNAALSAAVSLGGSRLVGLILPTAWTAAGIGFYASYDGGTTYVQVRVPRLTAAPPYNLDEYEILAADVPTAESVFIALDPRVFLGATHVKAQSQTAGTPVNQGGARTVLFVVTADVP